jgi:hypothetical protein
MAEYRPDNGKKTPDTMISERDRIFNEFRKAVHMERDNERDKRKHSKKSK